MSNTNINQILQQAYISFQTYKNCSLQQRGNFLRTIAGELENIRGNIVPIAMKETHLPEGRLNGELSRTIFQLKDYADHLEEGSWLTARINKGQPAENTDIRKMMVPLGPIVVLGASNFPFAFSTAGGDTASALAAGCPVILKGHPNHKRTSQGVADVIIKASDQCGVPKHVFQHVQGDSFQIGQELIKHPLTKAVSFTGSFSGGKSLFDLANQRQNPIPVFAEMGSVNPVCLLPKKLKEDMNEIAKMIAESITQNAGQFCTNPGLIIGIESNVLEVFIAKFGEETQKALPELMLHDGIYKAYLDKKEEALAQKGITIEAIAELTPEDGQAMPTLASVQAETFLKNPLLHQEVFGPYSLIVKCRDKAEMLQVIAQVEGQLTSTLMATEKDILDFPEINEAAQQICGRLLMNGVPTGVAVCTAMQHGGPYPATTDSRFSSVGFDSIFRFVRPLSFQNVPDSLLPEALKNNNPLNIWRTVNDILSKDAV